MTKEEIILAALSASEDEPYSATQVQKFLFLIDQNISDEIKGPCFNFQPDAYGPFDAEVCKILTVLSFQGMVMIQSPNGCKTYQLTVRGYKKGEEILNMLSVKAFNYIKNISEFIRKLSFRDLVSIIYKEYPEMKENSVFKN